MSDIRDKNIHGHTVIGSYNNTISASENTLLKKLEDLNVRNTAYNSETRYQKEDGNIDFIGHDRDTIVTQICERLTRNDDDKPICLVTAPAGYGKTTVAHRIAKLFDNADGAGMTKAKLAGTFFFRRGTRDDGRRLFPTLAHQLVRWSFIKESFQALNAFPDNLGDQFKNLVLRPLFQNAQTSIYIFIIDALDECQPNDAERIVKIFAEETIPSNIRFVLTARKDPALDFSSSCVLSFETKKISDNGIRNLLKECFDALSNNIKKLINADNAWPSDEDFLKLAGHAEGVPLYIATLVRYTATPTGKDTEHQSPVEKLEKVMKGYNGLDSLYQEVFASARVRPAEFLNVAGILLTLYEPLSLQELAEMLNWKLSKLLSILQEFHAVISIPDYVTSETPITFFHTSLRNYLTDHK
ncbi:hypothetical protein M422DRAFT_251188 [Sphaerobolus stellatus SS14]|uniref:NACHT domain-containing protein n=1 Tax=Sphaerobolus stellatus (strain SS14) TaxID=990650 RepID=A0A0C9VSI1_SPHS4|nr:hypothetical protein M422DRAFT_251188 [Sphaerobolus stellatus SS14]